MSEKSAKDSPPSISSAEGSPARISRPPAREPDSGALGLASGSSISGSFAHYDLASSSWRTYQLSLLGGSAPYSEGWPRAGMTLSGIAYPRQPAAPLTAVIGSSWSRGEYPTPSATPYGSNQGGGAGANTGPVRESLHTWARQWYTPTAHAGLAGPSPTQRGCLQRQALRQTGNWLTPTATDHKRPRTTRATDRCLPEVVTEHRGHLAPTTCTHGGECRWRLNPRFVEWLMGFPEGWTDVD